MNPGEGNFIRLLTIAVQTGWIVVVLLGLFVIAWGVLRWLTKHWREEAGALAEQLSVDLHELTVAQQTLGEEAAHYPPDVPPPYQTTARRLQQTMATITGTVARLREQSAALEDQQPPHPHRPLAQLVFALRREPHFWHRRRDRLDALVTEVQALNKGEVAETQAYLKELRAKPLDVAQKVRARHEALIAAKNTARALRTAGLYGEELSDTVTSLETGILEIQALPSYLLEVVDRQVLHHADPSEVGRAWQALSALENSAVPAQRTIDRWDAAHRELVENLETMHQTVNTAVQALHQVPDTIDLEALSEADQALRVAAQTLASRYVAFTLEDLEARDDVRQTIEQAERLNAEVAAIQAMHTALAEAVARNAEHVDQIEAHLRPLTDAARYPLDRVPFQVALDELTRQAADIGDRHRRRTPDQLEAHLAAAQAQGQRAELLITRITEARKTRRQLIEQMEAAAERAEIDWMFWAEDVDRHTRGYALENWDEELRVATVLDDARALAERRATWVPDHPETHLDPGTLDRRVQEVQAYYDAVETFQDRLERVTAALQDLQAIEAAAVADRDAVYGAMARLDETAGATLHPDLAQEDNHWHALREHLAVGRDLEQDLAALAMGTVAAKAEAVEAWMQDVDKTLIAWQRTLHREWNDAHTTLEQEVIELREIAPLDQEPAMAQAQAAIEQQAPGGKPPRRREASQAQITDTCRQIGEVLHALTRLDQASADLHDTIFLPLNDAVRSWQATRQAARDAFEGLKRLEADSAQRWPPVSCGLETVAAQMALAEEARDRLRRTGDTVRRVAEMLTEMTQHAERIVALVERREAAYEALRPELEGILNDLDRWCDILEDYRDRHHNDQAIAVAVRTRLDEIEAAGTELQIRFEHAGLISGDEAQRALEHLWRQAHRDLPVGAGLDVLPAEAIERGRRG